jgi:carbon-monoxide dehydrogenase small subunit
MVSISTTADGVSYQDDVEPRMLLAHYLRNRLGRTMTAVPRGQATL